MTRRHQRSALATPAGFPLGRVGYFERLVAVVHELQRVDRVDRVRKAVAVLQPQLVVPKHHFRQRQVEFLGQPETRQARRAMTCLQAVLISASDDSCLQRSWQHWPTHRSASAALRMCDLRAVTCHPATTIPCGSWRTWCGGFCMVPGMRASTASSSGGPRRGGRRVAAVAGARAVVGGRAAIVAGDVIEQKWHERCFSKAI